MCVQPGPPRCPEGYEGAQASTKQGYGGTIQNRCRAAPLSSQQTPHPKPLSIHHAARCTGKWHQNQFGDWGSCSPRGCAEAAQPVQQPLAWVAFPQGHTDPLSRQTALSLWLAILPKYGYLLPQREGEGGH